MVETWWADRTEAREAERELCAGGWCGPGCCGAHTIVYAHRKDSRLHVRPGVHNPKPPPLAEELAALYPRAIQAGEVESWPMPAKWNEPFGRSPTPGITAERMARVRRAAGGSG
jgi:hypothetical protein